MSREEIIRKIRDKGRDLRAAVKRYNDNIQDMWISKDKITSHIREGCYYSAEKEKAHLSIIRDIIRVQAEYIKELKDFIKILNRKLGQIEKS